MPRATLCLLCLFCLAAPVLPAAPPGGGWTLAFRDDFRAPRKGADPPVAGPGSQWVPLRGDWFVTAEGRLRTQRIWPSDSAIMLDIPFRGVNIRAEMDVIVGKNDTIAPHLQSGEALWGGGGIHDGVRARIFGGRDLSLHARLQDGQTKEKAGVICVEPLKPHRLVIQLEDGAWFVEVAGKRVREGKIAQGRSQVNCRFAIFAIPNGEIDNLRIYTSPLRAPRSAATLNTEAANRIATVDASKYLDPKLAGCGFQKAIDSLPPNGGCVILPEGRFLMRRHLLLPSHVTLRGRGAGKTTLVHCDTARGEIVSAKSGNGRHLVVLKDASAFRPGDAVCYGGRWAHPGTVGVHGVRNRGVLVLEVKDNTLALTEPPGKRDQVITHFFPLVYSRWSEFVELKDLTLIGPEKNPVKAGGGFMTNLVTFGAVSGGRVTRVEGRRFPADGFSMQGGADYIVTDNTVSETSQGFHPGTTTSRYLWARNLSVSNRLGLYFCWYNSRGVYTRSTYSGMGGYPDAGDFFNVIAFNRDERQFRITNGASGVYFGNECKGVLMNAHGKASRHLYSAAPRYFVIAANRMPKFATGEKVKQGDRGPLGNIIAANRTAAGRASAIEAKAADKTGNVLTTEGPADFAGIAAGCGRDQPVPPPALPEPILDGAKYYRHGLPDCGFQKALDELGRRGGGTLRLPAGRYVIGAPLTVPSNTTLAGQGMATVLLHDPELRDNRGLSAISTASTENVVIRELALEGAYAGGKSDRNLPAITVMNAKNVRLDSIDVRGWRHGAGIGIVRSEGVLVQDCRVVECEAGGFQAINSKDVVFRHNLAIGNGIDSGRAREAHGLALAGVTGKSVVEGNIAARNRAAGIGLRESDGVLIAANNATCQQFSRRGCGILLERGVTGVALGEGCRGNRVLYNRVGDDRLVPVQRVGIMERKGASGNTIMYNATAPHHGKNADTICSEGTGSTIERNLEETILPSGSSLEEWQQGRAVGNRVTVMLDWQACTRQWHHLERERVAARKTK